ncbi:MAG: GNAT family N-acetyltransferase [Bacilli bacterium]
MKTNFKEAEQFPSFFSDPFELRLVKNQEEMNEVLKLRYEDLLLYYNAQNTNDTGLFTDQYDDYCEHLIVIDHTEEVIAGTYRFVRKDHLISTNKFITENEYDLTPLKPYNIMELGRAVVRKEYRSGSVIMLLWRGIFTYAKINNIHYMFGTASFNGTNIKNYEHGLSYLYYHYLAELSFKAHNTDTVKLNLLPQEAINETLAKKQLPPLVKGYLRVGAKFASEIFIDYPFNSIDVLVLLDVYNIDQKHIKKIVG